MDKLKIHAYIITYNEELIISKVLDYYTNLCSKVFVVDNLSTDRTQDIALSYSNVDVIEFDTGGKKNNNIQSDLKSQLYRKYSAEEGKYTTEVADWVICVDADEILYHPNLIEILSLYDEEGINVPRVTGFNMVSEEGIHEDSNLIADFKYGVRSTTFDKPVLFKPSFPMTYSMGAHPRGDAFDYMVKRHDFRTSNSHPIALLHYKHIGMRLFDSAETNISRLGLNSLNPDYKGQGKHYLEINGLNSKKSPLLKQAKQVIDEDLNIRFDCFDCAVNYNRNSPSMLSVYSSNLSKISRTSVDKLRSMAISFESKDIFIARDFMILANFLRPGGPFIKRKLDEYEKKIEQENCKHKCV